MRLAREENRGQRVLTEGAPVPNTQNYEGSWQLIVPVVWFDWSREDKVHAGRLTLEIYGTQHTITNLSLISKAVRGWMKGVF